MAPLSFSHSASCPTLLQLLGFPPQLLTPIQPCHFSYVLSPGFSWLLPLASLLASSACIPFVLLSLSVSPALLTWTGPLCWPFRYTAFSPCSGHFQVPLAALSHICNRNLGGVSPKCIHLMLKPSIYTLGSFMVQQWLWISSLQALCYTTLTKFWFKQTSS